MLLQKELCERQTKVRPPHSQAPTGVHQENSPDRTGPHTTVRDIPAVELDTGDHCLSISSTGTPCRIRLVDCQALTESNVIRIVEFPEFPTVPYSAISYPWRGVAIDSSFSGHKFAVRGAEHADPVGTDALKHACAASLTRGNPYLWVDRLCIIQTNREDKNWQIRNMYKVYKSCQLCIVLAGGVQRLVRLDEETTWIHRSWTLQEVLAPPQVVVLLDWKLGPGNALSGGKSVPIGEAVAGESAIAPLSLVLEACTVGSLSFTPPPASPTESAKSLMIAASIFSAHQSKHSYNDIPFWRPQRKILAPNVVALTIAMDETLNSDPDTRHHAVWQSALMRTSSYPVDMVFSIMGLFDVELNPASFDRNDRRGATIALAQAILNAGGSASWLGANLRLEPDRFLSTFSTFPQTSVSGIALVRHKDGRVQEVSELVDPAYPVAAALVALPKGSMDDAGYLTFSARAVRVRPTERTANESRPSRTFVALDASHWEVCDDDGEHLAPSVSQDTRGTQLGAFAVLLGWFNRYYPGFTSPQDDNIRVMLLEEHRAGMFHLRSFFTLDWKTEKVYVVGWPEREFRVGGPYTPDHPDVLLSADTSEGLAQTYSERDEPWPRYPWRKPIATLEDEAIMKARWAAPQRVLERYRKEQT